jgi:hypothetical protein
MGWEIWDEKNRMRNMGWETWYENNYGFLWLCKIKTRPFLHQRRWSPNVYCNKLVAISHVKGYLILFERRSPFNLSKLDGPRIDLSSVADRFVFFLARHWIFFVRRSTAWLLSMRPRLWMSCCRWYVVVILRCFLNFWRGSWQQKTIFFRGLPRLFGGRGTIRAS